MSNMQDWESLIAERTEAHGTVKTCTIEDASKRNRKNTSRIYENRPSTKEKRKAWAQSHAGKKSAHDRSKRYRATAKGKIACRRKSSRYFHRHKNDPAWRAHRLEIQQYWKANRRAKRILARVPFEYKITLQDIGTITVRIYKGVA